jgi:hypothetical protein
MTIAATRMYRGLDDFLSSDVYDNSVFLSSLDSQFHCSSHVSHNGGRRVIDSGARTVPNQLDGIVVNVHTTQTHSLTSHAIRPSLGSDMDKQLQDKPHELV